MSTPPRLVRPAAFLAISLSFLACDQAPAGLVFDVPDTVVEVVPETVADADAEPEPEPIPEPVPDPEPDAVADAVAEPGPEPEPDTVADSGPDATPEEPGCPPDACLSPFLALTLNRAPLAMNGSLPFTDNDGQAKAFQLAAPPHGFTVDVAAGEGVDLTGLRLTADVAAGDLPAGTGLAPLLLAGDSEWPLTWRVGEGQAFSPGQVVTLQASAPMACCHPVSATYSFAVAELAPELDPFPHDNLWLVTFSRDLFSVVAQDTGDAYTLTSTPGGNGVPDFDEALLALGFLGPDPVYNAQFVALFKARLREHMHRMFLQGADGSFNDDSVRVVLAFEGDPVAPDPADFAVDGDFSMIAVGGDILNPDGTPQGYFGMAWIDPHNQSQEDDTPEGLGVFFTSLMRRVVQMPALKVLISKIFPGVGVPFGAYAGDLKLLDPTWTSANETDPVLKQRYGIWKLFLDVGTLGLAALTCHEMGHSLGLVAPGPPPGGLFGGASLASFVMGESDDWHLNTAGPNIMQTGASTNMVDYLQGYPAWEPLSRAYLQRRLVVAP